jgi:hypothetical protein
MSNSNDAYKRFIDELVALSRISVTAERIRGWGHSERKNETAEFPLDEIESARKTFILSLSEWQKQLVAELLEEEYMSAIHDVASFLEGRLSSYSMKMSWHGENIPASPYETMLYDYTCRRNGDPWPDELTT